MRIDVTALSASAVVAAPHREKLTPKHDQREGDHVCILRDLGQDARTVLIVSRRCWIVLLTSACAGVDLALASNTVPIAPLKKVHERRREDDAESEIEDDRDELQKVEFEVGSEPRRKNVGEAGGDEAREEHAEEAAVRCVCSGVAGARVQRGRGGFAQKRRRVIWSVGEEAFDHCGCSRGVTATESRRRRDSLGRIRPGEPFPAWEWARIFC